MQKVKKISEKTFIKLVFLIPFITCGGTAIAVRQFMVTQIMQHPELYNIIAYREIFDMVVLCLFINTIISFISLLLYFCLESKVRKVIKRKK